MKKKGKAKEQERKNLRQNNQAYVHECKTENECAKLNVVSEACKKETEEAPREKERD